MGFLQFYDESFKIISNIFEFKENYTNNIEIPWIYSDNNKENCINSNSFTNYAINLMNGNISWCNENYYQNV